VLSAALATTARLNVSVDAEPHPMIEQFAAMLLGKLAADGTGAVHVVVTINGDGPKHSWVS